MNAFWISLLVLFAQLLPQPGSVQGTVVKRGSGDPISGVRVELIRTDGTAPQSYTTTSASDGTFTIPNARPGMYRLAASRSGYLRREFGQRSRTGTGLTLNIGAGQPLRNLEIELRPAAAISGRVTDAGGDPVAAAEVKALVPVFQDRQRRLRAVQSTITDDLGEYRLFGLPAGQYYISASASADSLVTSLIVNPGPNSPAGIPFNAVGGIAGGSPSFSAVYYPGTTDSRTSTPIDVTSGGDFGGANITIVPLKTHHIRGTVPGGMANVTLGANDPGMASLRREADASSGVFDFPNVAPGEYTLVAKSGELLGATPVNVGDNDLDGVILGLNSNVLVPTRVRIDDRPPTDNDSDLESVHLSLLADPPVQGIPADVYVPFPDGSLSFEVLMRQDYRITNLMIQSGSLPTRLRNAYIKSIRMGAQDVFNNGFRVEDPANIAAIEIVIGTQTGALTGSVVGENQKPAANVTVLLVPDGGRRRWSDAYLTAATDLAGRYAFERVPPGDYIVFSWEEIEDGAWMDPDFMKKHEDRGRRIHINEGTNPNLNITAIP